MSDTLCACLQNPAALTAQQKQQIMRLVADEYGRLLTYASGGFGSDPSTPGYVELSGGPGTSIVRPIYTEPVPTLVDPFSRNRTSQPSTMFDGMFTYRPEVEKWGSITANGGAFSKNNWRPEIDMTVTSTLNSRVVRQSYEYVPYQPGKGKLFFGTGIINTTLAAGVRGRIGMFDDHNDKTAPGVDAGGDGVYFECNGPLMSVVIRSHRTGSSVEERALQVDWNFDKLDGSGDPLTNPSGLTLDPTQSQIYGWDLEWLGVGTALAFIVINRKIVPVHFFHHANLTQGVYMRRATLPVRYELQNTAGTNSGAMVQICSTVISEGGYEPRGDVHSITLGTTAKSVGISETPLLAVRLKPEFSRARLTLISASAHLTSNDTMVLRLYSGIGLTLTGASWVDVDTTNSVAQYDRSATAFSNGIRRGGDYVSPSAPRLSFPIGDPIFSRTDIQGNTYPILITGQNFQAGATAVAALSWQEIP